MNPVEVDTKIAEVYTQLLPIRHRRTSLLVQANRARSHDAKLADLYAAEAGKLDATLVALEDSMQVLEAKYTGWTRAFVVPDGHVHRSMGCSTCYPTTEFGWVTELSGSTEEQIIEAAGSRACTVCYPNAPVDAPAGRIFHATELAAQAARDERAAKKAAADAKKAANAIGPYRTSDRDLITTVYAAKAYLTDGFSWGWSHPSFSPQDRDAIAGLLAAKQGTTSEKELEAAIKRAVNRS